MSILFFAILGLVQGLTEFLPVSSSGHIFVVSQLLGTQESLFVSIVLHVATLFSIFVVMRKEIWCLIRHPFSIDARKLYISTAITICVVLLIYDFAKSSFMTDVVSITFMITAILLIATELFTNKEQKKGQISYKNSILMGIAQGLAIFPGLSRSGCTICAGMLSGGEKQSVVNHSFIMSIPIIIASMMMEIVEIGKANVVIDNYIGLIVGFVVAFVSGVFALKFMTKTLKKIKLRYFAFYLVIISILTMFI